MSLSSCFHALSIYMKRNEGQIILKYVKLKLKVINLSFYLVLGRRQTGMSVSSQIHSFYKVRMGRL